MVSKIRLYYDLIHGECFEIGQFCLLFSLNIERVRANTNSGPKLTSLFFSMYVAFLMVLSQKGLLPHKLISKLSSTVFEQTIASLLVENECATPLWLQYEIVCSSRRMYF